MDLKLTKEHIKCLEYFTGAKILNVRLKKYGIECEAILPGKIQSIEIDGVIDLSDLED